MATIEDLLKLVLDEDRLVILGMAAQGPCSADTMAGALAGKRTNLARHLTQLVDAGLLETEGDPGQERYQLNVREVQALKRTLFARPQAQTEQTPEEKVLSAFVQDGKLTHLPVQHGKRLIVLDWLAQQFAADREYSEREVNELLAAHGEDPATLRRYLVDYGFFDRAGGIYRRRAVQ